MRGRNAETWDKPGLRTASERFNYDYTEQELPSLCPLFVRWRSVPNRLT